MVPRPLAHLFLLAARFLRQSLADEHVASEAISEDPVNVEYFPY